MPEKDKEEVLDPEKIEQIVRDLKMCDDEIKEWEAWAAKNFDR